MDINQYIDGYEIDGEWWDSVVVGLAKLSNIVGAAPVRAEDVAGGTVVSLKHDAPFWALLSGSSSPYSFVEQVPDPIGWVSGTRTGAANAFDVNGIAGQGGMIVLLRPGAPGDFRFAVPRYGSPCSGTTCFTVLNECDDSPVSGASVTISHRVCIQPGPAPTKTTAAGSTSLANAFAWRAAYTYLDGSGDETTRSAPLIFSQTTGQRNTLHFVSLPSGAVSRNIYLSADGVTYRLYASGITASSYALTSAYNPAGALPPTSNETCHDVSQSDTTDGDGEACFTVDVGDYYMVTVSYGGCSYSTTQWLECGTEATYWYCAGSITINGVSFKDGSSANPDTINITAGSYLCDEEGNTFVEGVSVAENVISICAIRPYKVGCPKLINFFALKEGWFTSCGCAPFSCDDTTVTINMWSMDDYIKNACCGSGCPIPPTINDQGLAIGNMLPRTLYVTVDGVECVCGGSCGASIPVYCTQDCPDAGLTNWTYFSDCLSNCGFGQCHQPKLFKCPVYVYRPYDYPECLEIPLNFWADQPAGDVPYGSCRIFLSTRTAPELDIICSACIGFTNYWDGGCPNPDGPSPICQEEPILIRARGAMWCEHKDSDCPAPEPCGLPPGRDCDGFGGECPKNVSFCKTKISECPEDPFNCPLAAFSWCMPIDWCGTIHKCDTGFGFCCGGCNPEQRIVTACVSD